MRQARGLAGVAAVAATVLVGTAAWAQDARSAPGARELAEVLAAKKLDAIAARDPGAPNAFVAALHFPGQLMVISAQVLGAGPAQRAAGPPRVSATSTSSSTPRRRSSRGFS